jgi:hypothetical protein
MVDRFFAAAGQTTMKSMAHMKPCKATHQKPESFNFSFPLSGFNFMPLMPFMVSQFAFRFLLWVGRGCFRFPVSGLKFQVSNFRFPLSPRSCPSW